MKKPKLQVESPQPRQVQRADLAPTTGYAIVVDGRFKTEFDEEKAAKKAAIELLAKYPMLRIEIYNASSKSRIPGK
jgi:recombinational DNA repair protein RecT